MGISTENFNKNPKGTLEKLENNLERIFKEYTFLEKKIHKHIYIYTKESKNHWESPKEFTSNLKVLN